ncbi:MAG: hypothetical protein D6685_18690 [Bacteroidetes bacterium]|nr:MAG: hypothetical protein D6685_18690 [Bacteroidota bacterium]
MRHHFEAPWGSRLTLITLVVMLILVGVSLLVPVWSRYLLLAIVVASAAFAVRGYRLEDGILYILRPGWSTRIDLSGLTHVVIAPEVMRWSLRLFGNGGLFSYTGLFHNRRLGTYRAYVTDQRRTVVLHFRDARPVVLSPDDPEAFVHALEAMLADPA